jgi:hypothetical protein
METYKQRSYFLKVLIIESVRYDKKAKNYNVKFYQTLVKMFLCRHKLSGMDMTLCDYDGRTALHLASAEGHLECVTFLLEHCNVPHNTKDRSAPFTIKYI